jgi:chitodextrinase
MLVNKRAISPVIASVMLVGLAIAGGAVVALIINNSINFSPTIDSDEGLGLSGIRDPIDASVSVVKLAKLENVRYYESIDIRVTFNGPHDQIFVYDVDIEVDGIKLDEFSEWKIVNNGPGSVATFKEDDSFGGYRQFKGSSVVYKVAPEDVSNLFARIYDTDSFTFKVKVGTVQGLITHTLTNVQYATEVFEPIFFNVTLFHYNQNPSATSSAVYQIEQRLIGLNGSKEAYFLYNPSVDRFDTSTDTIDVEYILSRTDILITAEWGINTDVAAHYYTLRDNGLSMFFFGSIASLQAAGKYDNTATLEITGNELTPTLDFNPSDNEILWGKYEYALSSDPLLFGLSGEHDIQGDNAVVQQITSMNDEDELMIRYGIIDYRVLTRTNPNHAWQTKDSALGELFTLRERVMTGNQTVTGDVISIPLDPAVLAATHRHAMVRNALLVLMGEGDRMLPEAALQVFGHSIDGDSVSVSGGGPPSRQTTFSQVVSFQVFFGDIANGTADITYIFPGGDGGWEFTTSDYWVSVKIGRNAAPVDVLAQMVQVDSDYHMTVSLSDITSSNIVQNTEIFLIYNDLQSKTGPNNVGVGRWGEVCAFWAVDIQFLRLNGEMGSAYHDIMQRVPYEDDPSNHVCGFDEGTEVDITPPAAVTGLSEDNQTISTIGISWNPNTEEDLDFYEIVVNGSIVGTTTDTSYIITDRISGYNYEITLYAYDNSTNRSDPSTIYVFIPDQEPPSQVTGLVATAVSDSYLTIQWNPATDNVAVSHYNIYRNGTLHNTTTNTFFNDTGLDYEVTYVYSVEAVDTSDLVGLMSSDLTLTTADTSPPSQVTGLQAFNITTDSLDLIWEAATDDFGIAYYLVYRDGEIVANVTSLSFSDVGLNNDTTYIYQVRAVDTSSNFGPLSDPYEVSTLAVPDLEPPSQVENLSNTTVSATSTTLTWDEATDNVAVSHYNIYRNGTLIGTTSDSTFFVTGLTAETAYNFTVVAVDTSGNIGNASNPLIVITLEIADTDPPNQVTNLTNTTTTSTVVILEWDEIVGSDIDYYEIFRDGFSIGYSLTNNFTDSNVTEYTTYTYTVRAVDTSGNEGDLSDPLVVQTLDETPPTQVAGVIAEAISATEVELSWDAASDEHSGVSHYEIYRNGILIDTTTLTKLY